MNTLSTDKLLLSLVRESVIDDHNMTENILTDKRNATSNFKAILYKCLYMR